MKLLTRDMEMNCKKAVLTLCLLCCGMNVSAQFSLGNTGLLNIPTADMQETGTFMGGANYLPQKMMPFDYDTGNYFVNLTFLSVLELSYRCTLLKRRRTYDKKPGYYQQDRSVTARVRLLKERKWYPSVVVGTNDPWKDMGNNYFASVYGVMTKGISLAKGDRLAFTAGYYVPLNKLCMQEGVFAGISYSPSFCRMIHLMAEYDSKGFNAGASARLWKHLSIHIFTREFACIAGGIRYECTLIH